MHYMEGLCAGTRLEIVRGDIAARAEEQRGASGMRRLKGGKDETYKGSLSGGIEGFKGGRVG
jgi:hypothetical protein